MYEIYAVTRFEPEPKCLVLCCDQELQFVALTSIYKKSFQDTQENAQFSGITQACICCI
jgi:hypothetical protein